MTLKSQWKINDIYIPYIDCPIRTQIFFGGAASGKSKFEAQRCVYDLAKGGRNYLIIRNTGNTHKASTHNEITKVIDEWKIKELFKIHQSELTITCRNGYQAIFAGLDDVQKIKSITPKKGVITDIWIEEATETGATDCRDLRKRLRGLTGGIPKRFTLTFNPIFKNHWIFEEFFFKFHDDDREYRDAELSILRTTHKDNRFLENDDRAELENEKNQYYRDVYTLGKWGVLGHLIFKNWRVENLAGFKDALGTYHNGLDFGYTNDPTALARCSIANDKKLYICREFYEYGLTNDLIADKAKPIIGKEIIRCDPAEPKSIAELRGHGINAVAARGGKGSVNQGIQFIQQHEIIIDRECQNAINEIQLYQWELDKAGNAINTPVGKRDHFIAALRYALSGISFPAPRTQQGHFDRRLLGLPD